MMDTLPNNGITIVEQPQTGLKQPLRVVHDGTEAAEDAALVRAEERLIDEELTSEDEPEDAEKMERKLVTVALVKSVVETRGNKTQSKPAPVSPRYGLRKRRRSTGIDTSVLENNQTTSGGALARANARSRPDASRSSCPDPVPHLAQSSIVPNPLASIPINPPPALPTQVTSSSSPDATPVIACPLPAEAESTKQEKTPEPPDPQNSADKRKVTISEPMRSRGFSIDLDSVGFDFPEDATNTELSVSSGVGGRGRAFSFECFAFGINADEPLPPLQDSSDFFLGRPRQDSLILIDQDHPVEDQPGRMRGDSIIFDPSSFQDGGIHEQNALEKATNPESEDPEPHPGQPKPDSATSCSAPPTSKTKSTTAKPAPTVTLSSSPPTLPAVTSYTATTTTTTNSNTTTTVTITASSNTASISMELLNKDGRIGIYLPEARKARIARFHAKRARRIWRKRIKYDCRKKLADSRPRIKGRFVKRSDMEEE